MKIASTKQRYDAIREARITPTTSITREESINRRVSINRKMSINAEVSITTFGPKGQQFV